MSVESTLTAREAARASRDAASFKRCRAGSADVCAGLARRFEESNPALSTELRALACLAGDVSSCERLGHRLVEGLGIAADVDAGLAVLRATCAASATACFSLTLHLEEVAPDEALAAAARGCHAGRAIQCHQAGELTEPGDSAGESAAWFDTACALGHAGGCEALVELAESGRVPIAAEGLERLRRKACEVGVHVACGAGP